MEPVKNGSLFRVIFSRRMFVAFAMGFSCGLPLLLTSTIMQAWMKAERIDLPVIGMTALVGFPYTVKFLWAPLLDRYTPPFFGRRRGWLILVQAALMMAIAAFGLTEPGFHPWVTALAAFLIAFFSASQDIVVDAYRREDLADEELGFGSSLYVNGYRIGMLLAGGGGLILSDHVPFSTVYLIMAFCMLPGILTTLLTPEPEMTDAPATFREAVAGPLVEYFTRKNALLILLFILLYKIGDTMAGALSTPFYLELGFSKTEIGAIVKLFGFWATVAGALIGGGLMLRLGVNRSLWVFGFLQGVSTAGFALLARSGYNLPLLSGVIAFENLTGGMGTAAYVAFMASITNRKFTATQYALLSSLMGVPRVIASEPTGFLAKGLGWEGFFIACTLVAIP
ncbi:MAG: AmpG family muropeptide MFS transporter, partial [Syntrophales bacterium LBB04]|nr:AmpG family muropeptide MFS transporter [Syntrophales bacterium LBB04]